jgi:hypothetical protein
MTGTREATEIAMNLITIDTDNAVVRFYMTKAVYLGVPFAALKQLRLDLETMAMRMANESADAPGWRVEVML